MEQYPKNSIIFETGPQEERKELLRLTQEGDIYIKGKKIDNDKEVVDAMREFLKEAGFIKNN